MRGLGSWRRTATVIVGGATLLVASVLPAVAASYSQTPKSSWSTTNGRVYAMARAGNVIILGGSFTQLRSPNGAQTVTRNYLAALDATTGALLSWNPNPNAEVRAFAVSPDAATVYVGGSFTNIAAGTANRIAALSVSAGTRVGGFSATANGAVRGLALRSGILYLGGSFSTVDSTARTRIAAIQASSGALVTGFNASADNTVSALTTLNDGRLVVGGYFTSLNGESRDYLGAVDGATGAISPWRPVAPCSDTNNLCNVLAVATDQSTVYAGVAGPGGRAIAYDAASGFKRWTGYADGDVQALDYYDGVVYAGGHFDPDFGEQVRSGIVALSSATGAVLSDFAPLVRGNLRVWSVLAGPDALRLGGEFTTIDGVAQRGYAEFPLIPTPPDTAAPSIPTGLSSSNVTDTRATLRWTASTDNGTLAGYHIFRNGVQVASVGLTQWTDLSLSPSSTYTYTVTALDAAGNESAPSTARTVTTTPPNTSLVKPGSVWNYDSMGNDDGIAWRTLGYDDTSWSTGQAQLGFGDSDEQTVISPRGVTHYFRQTFAVPNPGAVTALTLRLLRDDGAIVYLNGTEVMRSNMPSGTVSYTTRASSEVTGSAESTFFTQAVSPTLLQAGTNLLAVELHDASGSSDASFDAELVPTYATDSQPPTTPADFRVTGATDNTISLAWTASSDNVGVAGYRITRDGSTTSTVTGTTFTDSGLAPGSTHTYVISAFDPANNTSGSATASGTTTSADGQPPSAPGSLLATPHTATVDLQWTASTDNVGVTGYEIRSGTTVLGTVGGSASGFTVTGLSPQTDYTFTVRARDAAGNYSDPSSVTTTTTADTQKPAAPANLRVSSATDTTVSLAWDPSTDNVAVDHYEVTRTGGSTNTVTGTTYTDTGLTLSTPYSYSVVAVDAAGNASDPATINASTTSGVLFSDTWTGSNGSAWSSAWAATQANGTIDVQGNAGALSYSDVASAYARAQLTGLAARTDMDVTFSYRWNSSGPRAYFSAYVRGSGGWTNSYRPRAGYGIQIQSDSATVQVQRVSGGTMTTLQNLGSTHVVGTGTEWVRLQIVGSTFRVKVWSGASEPSAWTWTGADTTVTAAGQFYASLNRGSTSTGVKSVLLDDLVIR